MKTEVIGVLFIKRMRTLLLKKFWFDSYGSPVLEEIVQTFKSPILGNTSKFQEFNTSYCGQLSLYFLYKINNGKSMEEICLELF